MAGLGLYDVVKSREGGLKGLKATNHMERGRKLVQKYDRPQQWHPVDIRETVVGRAGDRAAGRSGGQPCGWPRGREGEPAKLPGPITILLFHVNVFKACAWSKHSSFLKVKVLNSAPHNQVQLRFPRRCPGRTRYSPRGRTGRPQQKSNDEILILTATTWIYAIGAGITSAADTRLALQSILIKRVSGLLIPGTRHGCPVLSFLVTTSLC